MNKMILAPISDYKQYTPKKGGVITLNSLPDSVLELIPRETVELVQQQPFNAFPHIHTGAGKEHHVLHKQILHLAKHKGILLFVTVFFKDCDKYPLRSKALKNEVTKRLNAFLARYFPSVTDYIVVIQRGKNGKTHAHIILPKIQAGKRLLSELEGADIGKGGGILYCDFHVVEVEHSHDDYKALAVYVARDGDCRFDDDFTSPLFWQAMSEEVARRRSNARETVRLQWPKGIAARPCDDDLPF